MLVAQACLQLEAPELLPRLHISRYVALVLLVVAVGDISLCILETAAPSGVGVFLPHFYLTFPQGMAHDEFLRQHAAARLAL